MRANPLPEHNKPTIVFSGAIAPRKIDALREAQVESLMGSFHYLQSEKKRSITELYDWPVRRFLDSGVFTIGRKMGTSRIRIENSKEQAGDDATEKYNSMWAEYKQLVADYAVYLKGHLDEWDHVAEMDVDELFGPETTWKTRKYLHDIAGDKLLPVWHTQAGYESWTDMIATYPYVAVGSDAAVKSAAKKGGALPRGDLRRLVEQAHAQGVFVHGMGDTKMDSFLDIGWDSADSTTWISGSRFGMFAGIRYSFMESSSNRLRDAGHARQFEDFVTSQGLDIEEFRKSGEPQSKLVAAIRLLQRRQEEIRSTLNARLGVEVSGEHSGVSSLGFGNSASDAGDD